MRCAEGQVSISSAGSCPFRNALRHLHDFDSEKKNLLKIKGNFVGKRNWRAPHTGPEGRGLWMARIQSGDFAETHFSASHPVDGGKKERRDCAPVDSPSGWNVKRSEDKIIFLDGNELMEERRGCSQEMHGRVWKGLQHIVTHLHASSAWYYTVPLPEGAKRTRQAKREKRRALGNGMQYLLPRGLHDQDESVS
jgi:hypothetical protein